MITLRPTPVLLLPGWSAGAGFLTPLRERFVAAGWRNSEVRAHDFDDPHGGNIEHAEEVVEAIRDLQGQSGVGAVDVVAHSMGGLALRHLLLHMDASFVRRAVFLGTPHAGTYSAYFASGSGGIEMRPRSDFLRSISGVLPVPTLSIYTPWDTHVVPNWSAVRSCGEKARVWCSHRGMVRHAGTFERLRAFLGSHG